MASGANPRPGEGSRQTISPATRKRLQLCFERANKLMAQQDHDYAHELFTQCVLGDPGNIFYAQSLLGNLRQKFGDKKKGGKLSALMGLGAKGGLKKAAMKKDWMGVFKGGLHVLKSHPYDVGTLTTMAEACEHLEWDETQLVYLRAALEVNPADPAINRLCAIALRQRNEFDQAIACWNRVLNARPDDQEAQKALGYLAAEKTIQQGGYDKAESSRQVKPTAKAGPADREELAPEEQLRRKIKRNPNEVANYLELADLHLRAGRFSQAEAVLAPAWELSDHDPDVQEKLEDAQMRGLRKQYADAQREASKSDTDEARQHLAEIRAKLNEADLLHHEHLCQRYPTNLGFKYRLGLRYQTAGRYNDAIKMFQGARNEPRHRGVCLLELGKCFQQIKQYKLAMSHYDDALKEISEQDADHRKEALYRAGKLAFALKDFAAAEEHATQLAGMDFGYKDIASLLDKIAENRQD